MYDQSGGAHYGRGSSQKVDLLTVTAEAFERDADSEDFSLLAIVAHERGHQIVARHPRLSRRLSGSSLAAEEVLASLLGALTLGSGFDSDSLVAKATAELLVNGVAPDGAVRLIEELWTTMKELL